MADSVTACVRVVIGGPWFEDGSVFFELAVVVGDHVFGGDVLDDRVFGIYKVLVVISHCNYIIGERF